jgi:hypothetical protein
MRVVVAVDAALLGEKPGIVENTLILLVENQPNSI